MRKDRTASPYTLLAEGYDVVMAHVDYAMWAEYVYELLIHHHPPAEHVLELGCGTGSLAVAFQPQGEFAYHATDLSEEMLGVARRKAERQHESVTFGRMDFRNVPSEPKYDAIVLLYDGINYVTETAELPGVLQGVFDALRPGGVFIFDQSTPTNSLNHSEGFDDAGKADAFRYLRTSSYDPDTRLHTTLFRLKIKGATHTERHIQRAYTLEEMRASIEATLFEHTASYDGFTFDPASEASERIHHVLRRPGRG